MHIFVAIVRGLAQQKSPPCGELTKRINIFFFVVRGGGIPIFIFIYYRLMVEAHVVLHTSQLAHLEVEERARHDDGQ